MTFQTRPGMGRLLVLNSVTGARLYARILSSDSDVVRADVPGVGMVGFDRQTGHGRHALAAWQVVPGELKLLPEPEEPEPECGPPYPISRSSSTASTAVGAEFAMLRERRKRGGR
jgi:hypothetical protein